MKTTLPSDLNDESSRALVGITGASADLAAHLLAAAGGDVATSVPEEGAVLTFDSIFFSQGLQLFARHRLQVLSHSSGATP